MQSWHAMWDAQRPNQLLWVPVFLGLGIGVYFSLLAEPSRLLVLSIASAGLALIAVMFTRRLTLLFLIGVACLGFGLSSMRTYVKSAPVLGDDYRGPVEGRVVGLDRSARNAPRLVLDHVHIPGMARADVPHLIRISLHGFIADGTMVPGVRIATTAMLSAPNGPVEPMGFDFRRHAWYRQIGAVGYTRAPVLRAAVPRIEGASLWITDIRLKASRWIRSQMPLRSGAFAAAILTGDRSALDPASMDSLRASNLAHFLAISGLHMGLLTGCVFVTCRVLLAMIPGLALRYPIKKWAAGAALLAGLVYLFLSGASVATQRAFIMTSVILIAVWIERPAFTLRAVSIAATLVLVMRPESLLEAGFQMSFAATTALVATFNALRSTTFWSFLQDRQWWFVRPAVFLVISSFVAGLATAPFSAFHFNQIAQYGLLANLLAVPLMGSVVMPAAIVAICLAPLGWSGPALWVMDKGISGILSVAEWIAQLEGALWRIHSGPIEALALLALGLIFLVFWKGRLRFSGILVAGMALVLWSGTERPMILIDQSGRLVGVMAEQGRVLNRSKGHGFAAETWLENDGDAVDQVKASERAAFERASSAMTADIAGGYYLSIFAKQPSRTECRDTDILVGKLPEGIGDDCITLSTETLLQTGSVALTFVDGKLTQTTTAQTTGIRPWTRPDLFVSRYGQ